LGQDYSEAEKIKDGLRR